MKVKRRLRNLGTKRRVFCNQLVDLGFKVFDRAHVAPIGQNARASAVPAQVKADHAVRTTNWFLCATSAVEAAACDSIAYSM